MTSSSSRSAAVICATCQAEGKRSRVTPHGGSVTAMYCAPFYDEDGNHHHHDLNTRTFAYSCSEGHEWTNRSIGSCWCGWPDKEKTDAASK